MQHDQTSLAQSWSSKLGLALSHLFGQEDRPFDVGQHFALLDGVAASFSLSTSEAPPSSDAPAWAWSAHLRKHVWVEKNSTVFVSSVARPDIPPEQYGVDAVSSNLDRFLEYLSSDRQSPKRSVVDHVLSALDGFRQIALSRYADEESTLAIRALLLKVAQGMSPDLSCEALLQKYALATDSQREVQWLLHNDSPLRDAHAHAFDPHYGVAVRHAGGAIFQRATAQLTQLPQLDLFSGARSVAVGASQSLRQGGFFTPPGLARSMAEAAILGKIDRPLLRVCDPACGSGVFLAEVLRALQRCGYKGKVDLVGRDILDHAIEIARFVAQCAALDFGVDRVSIDIVCDNSLEHRPPGVYDIVLMNPPFRSWEQSSPRDKECVRQILGEHFKGKPDFSLAFSQLALDLLGERGTLATLLPVGVLSSDYASRWRTNVSRENTVSLIGSFGDHYIFEYALVNIAALVVHKRRPVSSWSQETLMLWANEDPKASAAALRGLRRSNYSEGQFDNRGTWRIYPMPQSELAHRQNWIPSATSNEDVIFALRQRQLPQLSALFKVRQGIRTGAREVFILSAEEWGRLPSHERTAFRPVIEKSGVARFRLTSDSYVFYADALQPPIENDEDFRRRFETFYENYVAPHLELLRARPESLPLWQLSRPRSWLKKMEPRIVSRMFIGRQQFGFAVDERGDRAIVQGYGWQPNWKAIGVGTSKEDRLVALYAYAYLFSSEFFYSLVQSVSINIAGGQHDLAPKFIDTLPVPTWELLCVAARSGLSNLDKAIELGEIFLNSPKELERFARAAYGVERTS